ncbi:phospho-sugar mutase [Cellulomonas hominis]
MSEQVSAADACTAGTAGTGHHGDDAAEGWPALVAEVTAWIADDPDPRTAAELTSLLKLAQAPAEPADPADPADPAADPSPEEQARIADVHAARADLADRFTGLLQFGTAGLRGAVGGGPNRMNRAVVIRAAAGLGAYLLGELDGVTPAPRVVVGHDARHGSLDFARDTAAVLTAIGIEVLTLPPYLPTPVLSFAVRHLGADAGVMVTASHNPAQDNGYKVYLGGRVVTDSGQGAQIVPPFDAAIAAEIARVPSVAAVPRAADGWTVLGPEIVTDYVDCVTALADTSDAARAAAAGLRIVLTPMHGVGGAVAQRVLAAAGYTDVHVVPEQAEPDPDFPTVAFPNPEEPGAIDLALALADAVQADIVLALDPDADRCAAAVLDPRARVASGVETAASAGWRMLHGDEVGALLGKVTAERLTAARGTSGAGDDEGGPAAGGPAEPPVLASSIVSSRLLSRIATRAGLRHAQTLTGFKWISRVDGLAFGYEEALGYCVDPAHVRDKDGISASLTMAGLATRLKARGRGPVDLLDDLARQHGLFLTDQLAARFTDLDLIPQVVARVREHPPVTLAGSPVVEVVDLAAGTDADRGGLPPTEGLRLLAADDTRVIIRPSGTEPKVKCYLEVIIPVEEHASPTTVGAARAAARGRLDAVRADVAAALGI